MKFWLFAFVMFLFLLSDSHHSSRFTVSFWGPFDAMTTITAYAISQQHFDFLTDMAITRFTELSNYYDRFSESGRIVNIAVLNHMAGHGAMPIANEVFDLLAFAQNGAQRTENLVLPTFGTVTELWRKQIKRSQNGLGTPPESAALKKAAQWVSPTLMRLDKTNSTVTLLSPDVQLDLGAVAKGFATELVGRELIAAGLSRLAISSGGNIRVFSPPVGKRSWNIGVQNPDSAIMSDDDAVVTLSSAYFSVATSGDYQRFFWYNNKRYHHLIEPSTLYPAQYYRSVTVACQNAGEADLFSSALFLADWGKSTAIAEKEQIAALWIFLDGTVKMNARMEKFLQ